jgi:hypothetical protein
MKVCKFINLFLLFCILGVLDSFSQVPLNWTIDEVNPGEDMILEADEEKFTEGNQSCYLQLLSGDVPYLISDYYFVTAGAEYQFALDVFDNDTSGQIKIYADFYDTYGFNVFGEEPRYSRDTNAWQTLTWEGTVPQQAVVGYVLIKYYCQPNLYTFTRPADIWIDNIQFLEAGGANLLVNGSFENWVLGVDEGRGIDGKLVAFPNPASGFVTLCLPGPFETISIRDIMGRELFKLAGNEKNEIIIDLAGWPGGVYFVTAEMMTGVVLSSKLLITG